MGGQTRVLGATLLWLVLLLQGCGGGGNDQDDGGNDDITPPPGTYTVTAAVTGISGHVQGNEYAWFTLQYTDQDGAEQDDVIGTNMDGTFTFRNAFLPNGASYQVGFRNADGFAVRCSVENGTGTVAVSNVTGVAITCVPTYTVGGQIKGIAITADTDLELQTLHNAELAPALSTVYSYSSASTRPFHTGGNAGFLPGDTYDISVGTQPANSDATCFVRGGSGTVLEEADVVSVEVLCTGIGVVSEVTGLSGSGLILRLNGEAVDGNGGMEMIEERAIDRNGQHVFHDVLFPGQDYRIEIHQQPTDPDQQCFVENGEGAAPENDLAFIVRVICPAPRRSYRFDNHHTRYTAYPLASGEQAGGEELYRSFSFGPGPAVPLGSISGFATSDLFQVHIDEAGADGVVYSNRSGETFWVAAESPTGSRYPQVGVSHRNYTELDTWWLFRKDSDSANLQLEVTEVFLLGFVDTHARDAWGSLYADADLWVRAFKESADGQLDEIFSRHGGIALEGRLIAPDSEIDWALLAKADPAAEYSLWSVNSFFFDLIGDEIGRGRERVALAFLEDSIPIPIDVSDVRIGEEFYVNARALVSARNSFSPEGGTAVFLRDPATFDAGDPNSGEPLDDPGSVRVVAAEGLTLLAIDYVPQPAPGAGNVPPACESDQRSVLEFGEPEYVVREGAENSTLIHVVRTGSLAGLVGARIRLEEGTALANEDFEPREIDILFGNEDDHPRTVELPIIDDDVIEPDEYLTITLVDPQGCAVIGAQGSAQVTIVDDDNRPGAISFASASIEVDESAGFVTIGVVRTGGHSGVLSATLETRDGTALASEGDYTPVLTTIVFSDGDTGPIEIQVPIGDDLLSEPDETFEITLSSFTSQINDPATMTVTIIDNDQNQANTVQFAAAEFTAVEADGRATISLTRHGDTSMPASVTVTTSDGTATAGLDYEALSAPVEFAAGEAAREIELVIVVDAVPEPDETVNLTLSAPSGVALGTPATAVLTITEEDATAWGHWQPDVEIDAAAGVANDAQIAFDSDGNALAMWSQESGNRTDIWSNYYEPGVGWGGAVLVQVSAASQYADAPRVAFDAQGNALAVWIQTDLTAGNVNAWANRFTPGAGWGVPELIDSGPDAVFGSVELAVASHGDAIAVWTHFDGAQNSIYANRYVAGSGWLGAEVLNEQNEIVRSAQVAMDHDGNMLVVWQQAPTGVNWNIRARRFTQTSWEPSELISTTNTGNATSALVSLDTEGGAMVVWLQNPGFDRAMYASRYTEQGGWETPELIGEGDGAADPGLAMGPDGNAIAIWQRPVTVNGNVVNTAFANRYTPDNGWAGAVAISTGSVFYPKVAMGPDGNALAAWFELDAGSFSSFSVWSNRYTLDVGWRIPEQIGSSGGLIGTFMPNLAFGPQGEAFAIWTRGGEVRVNNFRLAVLDAQ